MLKKRIFILQLIGEFQLHDLRHETNFHLSRVDAIFVGFYSQLLSLIGEGFGCTTHRENFCRLNGFLSLMVFQIRALIIFIF